jgi:plastocyanin
MIHPRSCIYGLLMSTFVFGYGGWAQMLPAPGTDRVLFPGGYQSTFTKLLTLDRVDNGQIRVVWGNDLAANTPWWEPYPYGSVLLFESFTSRRDSQGNLLRDEQGHLVPNALTTIFVKRKEPGFGEAYQGIRNGEWEYGAYRPDGSTQTPPQNTGACAACHLEAGPPADWTFRRRRFNVAGAGAIPSATLTQYAFLPQDLTVAPGTVVVWQNDDEVLHQIFSPTHGFFSPVLGNGMNYSFKFTASGEYDVRCSIHPGMRAKVTVK